MYDIDLFMNYELIARLLLRTTDLCFGMFEMFRSKRFSSQETWTYTYYYRELETQNYYSLPVHIPTDVIYQKTEKMIDL